MVHQIPTSLALQIYNETIDHLLEWGYISHLTDLLSQECIDDRMTRIDVPSCGLETVDAIHCVLDKNRTIAFLEAIGKSIRSGDVVVEAGLGTGIMAIMAAALGAMVYGIEINKDTLALSRRLSRMFIREGLFEERCLELVEGDATIWNPPEQIDLLISENIYSGMFYEMQIPIINHLRPFLSTYGRVIPHGMCSYVILAHAEKPIEKRHGELFSPSLAEKRIYQWEELSKPVLYDTINFDQHNDLDCSIDLILPVMRSGMVNSLLIYSPVTVAPNIILDRKDMIFLGEDIFIVIDPPLHVEIQSNVRLRMRYKKGSKPEDGSYLVERQTMSHDLEPTA